MAKKKTSSKTTKVYLMKPVKGLAYHSGEVHEMPSDLAEELIESGKARLPKETLPKDFPYRDEFIAAGYMTAASIEAIDDLRGVPGIGPAGEKKVLKALGSNS